MCMHRYTRYPLSGPRLCVHSVSRLFILSFFIHLFVCPYLCVYLSILNVVPVRCCCCFFRLSFSHMVLFFFCLWVCVFELPMGWNDIILEIPDSGFANIQRKVCPLVEESPKWPTLILLLLPFCTTCVYMYHFYGVFVLIVHKLISVESIAGFDIEFRVR